MEVVLILVVTGVIILAIKIAMTNPKESSNNQSQPKTETVGRNRIPAIRILLL